MAKSKTAADKRHLNKVAELGCIACINMGYPDSPAEIHHPRAGQGMSQRAPHDMAIPLCPPHHRTGGHSVAIHAGQEAWEDIHGTELELLDQVRGLL
jgi:hypothetical protein